MPLCFAGGQAESNILERFCLRPTAKLVQLPIPKIIPMPLAERPQPFDHPDWLFELKYDGFRALAYLERGTVRLDSRKGNMYKSLSGVTPGAHRVPERKCLRRRVQGHGDARMGLVASQPRS